MRGNFSETRKGAGSSIRAALTVCVAGAAMLLATNAQARSFLEIRDEVQAVLKDPNCRSKEFIDALIQEVNQSIDDSKHYPVVGRPRSYRGVFRLPSDPDPDDVILKRRAAHLPEKICPPPEPVKLYNVGVSRHRKQPRFPCRRLPPKLSRNRKSATVHPAELGLGHGSALGLWKTLAAYGQLNLSRRPA